MGTYRGCGWGRGGSVRRGGGAGQARRGEGAPAPPAPWRAGLLELWFKHSNGWLPPDTARVRTLPPCGKAFTSQGGQAGKRAGAAKQGEADVQEGRTGRPAAPRA